MFISPRIPGKFNTVPNFLQSAAAVGRLALVYGLRREPFGIDARLSADGGSSWGEPITLRDDGGGTDIGYPCSVVRPDGTVLSVYYYHDRSGPDRYLAATIWDPGRP